MLVLLGLSILLSAGMCRLRKTLSRELTEAARLALAENWQAADQVTADAVRRWERSRKLVAAVVDHELLEETEKMLSELAVYRSRKLSAEYAAVCLCLAKQAEAIGESQSLRWWHLL
jgi:hypothetical protein